MVTTQLNQGWQMRKCGDESYIDAKVPGTVYTDLLAAGKMEDPFYRDNELKTLEIIAHDYEYRTHFPMEEEWKDCSSVLLRFEGIDTLSTITLNGAEILKTDNMHRIYEIPVEKLLKEENELTVILHSPTEFIAKSYEENPIEGSTDAMRGCPHLRKAHCMFGWDWGPRIPDAGIFREVSLLGIEKARFEDVYVTQTHREDSVTLHMDVKVKKEESLSPKYHVTVFSPKGEKLYCQDSLEDIEVKNPELWWPNGYGSQPLYTVRVELLDGEKTLDVWERRIGLRTMTVRRTKDQYGESFAHEVNGVQIFAMGADYIPEDNILSRVTKERTRRLLTDARDVHMNVIRVWGGGYYPNDFFYDICDELGLIVWQDFMFACCVYDLTEDFEKNITAEFIDNIRRIRHHASLGLWCGNNEMEMFIMQDKESWCAKPSQFSDYIKMFEYIIPKVLKEYDPKTFYWPASPSSGGAFDDPNCENRGDVHYWDVWHGGKPITEYRKFYFRYVSEFGFQSFPSLETVKTFTEPEDRNIFSYVMEKHQRNASANGKIMNYMEQTFLYPNDFETTLYASQLLQAEAMRYGVEHFRRNRGRCMGSVIWQLNDCWPTASWASIDYFGRWKALHYYEKRFFAPVMVSCAEEGILTQDPNVNAQPYELKKSVTFCVANETMEEKEVTLFWELRDAEANILRAEKKDMKVPALSSLWTEKTKLPEADTYGQYVSYRIEDEGGVISQGTVLFCAPKHFHFRRPDIEVKVEGDELVVTAKRYAKGVCILNEDDTMLLDDNFFDMNAGTRRVRILEGKPEGLKVKSVYDIR